MLPELLRQPAGARLHQAYAFPVTLAYKAHGLREVAVVAHDDRAVMGIEPGVVQEMHRKIDIRTFFRS